MEETLQSLLETYSPSAKTVELVRSTPIVLLVGISGAGKDTIKHRLLETNEYHHIVSHTTRAPRENHGVFEQDGVDYHFISKEQAADMIRRGEFVEIKQYSGNIYGTSAAELQKAHDAGRIAVTDIEVQGVAEYKAISENVIAEFILPPSYDEWQRRLLSRYGDKGPDAADLAKRMDTAICELKEALSKEYYHFVINEDIDEAVRIVDRIAHKHDAFNQIDRSYHVWAEQILADLAAHQ